MPVRHITAEVLLAVVSCQRCGREIIVPKWRDAEQYGWAVPADGNLQLCPECLPEYKEEIIAGAVRIGDDADAPD